MNREHDKQSADGGQPAAFEVPDIAQPTPASLLQAAVDAIPHAVYIIGPDGRFVFQNSFDLTTFGDLRGRTADEIAGDIVGAAPWREAHRRALSGDQVHYTNIKAGPDGKSAHEVCISPITDGQGWHGAAGISINNTALLRAQDELARERDKLKGFIEASSDWVWEQDENFVFTAWHMPTRTNARSPVGYTRWDYAGVDIKHDPIWLAHHEQLVRHEPFFGFVYRTCDSKGAERYIEASGNPRFDADGKFTGYIGIGRDVTERERLIADLRRSQLVVDTTQNGIVICDANRLITWVNPAFEALSGYSAAEVIGRNPGAMLQSAQTDPATIATLRAALDQGNGVRVEILNTSKAGRDYWIDLDIRPVHDASGAVTGFISVESDITETVMLRRRLMAIFENVPSCIAVMNEEGCIVDCNPEVERLTGLPRERLIGLRCSDFPWAVFNEAGPPYAEQEHPVYVALRENRKVEDALIGYHPIEGGDVRWLKGNVNPVSLDSGKRIAIFSFTDITDELATRSALNCTLKEAQTTLLDLSAYRSALDQFATVMVADRDLRLTFVNDRFCEVTGYSREEALGRTVGELLDCDKEDPAVYENVRGLVQQGTVSRVVVRNRSKDGADYWVDETIVPQLDKSGALQSYLSISLDITERIVAERQMRASETSYRLLADNSSDVIILGHNDGRRSYFSPAVLKLTGYTPEEALKVSMRDWIHPDDLPAVFAATSKLSPERPNVTIEHRLRRKDGSYIWIEGAFARVASPDGDPYIVSNIRDVTKRKRIENEYSALFEHSFVGIYRRDLAGVLKRANPALLKMRGYASEAALIAAERAGQVVWEIDASRDIVRHDMLMREGVVSDHVSQLRRLSDGALIWFSETAWLVRDDDGTPLYIEGTIADVTERVQSQNAIQKVARTDNLTGLLNRFAFRDVADKAVLRASRQPRGTQLALIYVDLDRFKAINDSFGHAAGDELIAQIASRIGMAVGKAGVIARLGGDEFAILLTGEDASQRAEQMAVHLIAGINHPIVLGGGHIANVGASIGIATLDENETNAEQLIRRADLAMYQAKRDGRNAYRVYTPMLDEQVNMRKTIEAGLRHALVSDQFEAHFQPVFDLQDKRQSGFEALIRWRHPERGLISPGMFVPVAEEAGLIVPIGEWMFREAINRATAWPADLRVAINVSVIQLRHKDFYGCVVANLQRSGIDPQRIEIEVTESVLLDDNPTALQVLQKLQALGIKVALDDFGTGWSSLSYLNKHRFDRIKIDRSFVQGIKDRRNEAIIRAIVDMGSHLGIDITAEGIETEDQRAALAALGCHEGQGYLLGRPMPAEDALRMAQRSARGTGSVHYFRSVR